MSQTMLHERLQSVAGQDSYRRIGDKTQHNSETVRRYMKGQSPSVEFIAAFCLAYDTNESWLLTGRGPAKASDIRRHQLAQANPGELLAAVAEALERLTDRVDRIERYVQTMETRLRAGSVPQYEGGARGESDPRGDEGDAEQSEYISDPRYSIRASGVADAVSERPSTNTG